ncbi:MAG: hypothetical protein IPN76_00185 [Saprospiraceae bacterium]|nr:hypothetical protein [Saprospiraceae bacterium]
MKYFLTTLLCCCLHLNGFSMSGPDQSNSIASYTAQALDYPAYAKLEKRAIIRHLLKRKAQEEKAKDKSLRLVALGLLSLLLVSWALQFEFITIAGLVFFTLATGIGYLLSRKDKTAKRNKFPKAMFIVAIVANFLGAAIGYVFSQFVFD